MSIKSNNPIQQPVSHVDNNQTVICLDYNNQECSLIFDGDYLYKKLLTWLPGKEIMVVSVYEENRQIDNIENKLKQIKELYEQNLITNDEYSEKRRQLLEKI